MPRRFHEKSGAGFACCTGAIDGILIWIHKAYENAVRKLVVLMGSSTVVVKANLNSIVRQSVI